MTISTSSQAAHPDQQNTSGLGANAVVPPEIVGWSWGAFFLNWIWGIGNNTWRAFLVFIPFFGFVWIFVLGFKGNEWAWKHKRWADIQQFKRVQRKWAIASFIFWGIGLLLIPVGFLGIASVFKASEPYQFAMGRIQQDERVIQALGEPIEVGLFIMGNLQTSGPNGEASMAIPVSGPRASGTTYVIATKRLGRWTVTDVVVDVAETGQRIVIIPEP